MTKLFILTWNSLNEILYEFIQERYGFIVVVEM